MGITGHEVRLAVDEAVHDAVGDRLDVGDTMSVADCAAVTMLAGTNDPGTLLGVGAVVEDESDCAVIPDARLDHAEDALDWERTVSAV